MRIYVGSQTGTATRFAKKLQREGGAHGFDVKVIDLDVFDNSNESGMANAIDELVSGGLTLVLMATYGEGDPTDNALDFMKWLSKPDHPSTMFGKVKFSVFGLGNRQYEHFNQAGKNIVKYFGACGGQLIHRHGEGDDDGTMDEDFANWCDGLWDSLKAASGVVSSEPVVVEEEPSFDFRLVPVPCPIPGSLADVEGNALSDMSPNAVKVLTNSADLLSRHFFQSVSVPLVSRKQLRQTSSLGNSTLHVEFSIQDTDLHYTAADNLAVCANNPPEIVNAVAKWLKLDTKEWFTLEVAQGSPKPLFPTPCSVGKALSSYLDLSGLPSKDLLKQLSAYAGKSEDRQKMLFLASKEGSAEYNATMVEEQAGIFELFQRFPSLNPPLEALVQTLPLLAPRLYTIASSPLASPDKIGLCLSVINHPKKGSNPHRRLVGVCTNYLETLSLGSRVMVAVRKSTFVFPKDPKTPMILVGPGTGIAPMMAFLEERECLQRGGEALGHAVLFFGCRKEKEDFIYTEELHAYKAKGVLNELVTAFSRDTDRKVYVQHKIVERAKDLVRLIEQGAHIYVCGATAMGRDVSHAFETVRYCLLLCKINYGFLVFYFCDAISFWFT